MVIGGIFNIAKTHVDAQFWSGEKYNIRAGKNWYLAIAKVFKVVLRAEAKLREYAYSIGKHAVIPQAYR